MKIEDLLKEYQDVEQVKRLADAQNLTITKLQEENQKLTKEIEELKVQLAIGSPIIGINKESEAPISNEEFICINEIRKLRLLSETQHLTHEETKKFDTFVKVLNAIRSGRKTKDESAENLTEAELLQSLEQELK